MSSRELSNVDLKRAQVPGSRATWDQIQHFALTFDGYERIGKRLADLANRHLEAGSVPTDLTELRGCLFFEQRRWRHVQETPDKKAMRHIRRLVEGIRRELASVVLEW